MKSIKILITAPLKQERKIFKEFQDGLDRLEIPDGITIDRFYVVNDCPEIIQDIRGEYEVINTGDIYRKAINTHVWTNDNLSKMHELRNATIKKALDGGYDYWWSIDTDLVVHPQTLKALLEADKDIVAEIFWTMGTTGKYWSNAWLYDQATGAGNPEWRTPGVYEIGGTGACLLVKRKVFEAGVDYSAIPCIKKVLWGEDRHFCIRAMCAGFKLWLDTHYPAEHLYTEQCYKNFRRRRGDA